MAWNGRRRPTKPKRNTSPLERDEQEVLFDWAEYAVCTHPELALMYHIPNEGRRSRYAGYKMQLQGMRKGVPDICLPVPKGSYGALYIELKRKKGSKTSEDQRAWIDALNRVGNKAVVCKGFEEARDTIINYLNEGRKNSEK